MPTGTDTQIAHVLGNAGCRVVVCEEQFAARLIAGSHGTAVERVVCVDGQPAGTLTLEAVVGAGDAGFGFEDCWRAVAADDVLTLIYKTAGPQQALQTGLEYADAGDRRPYNVALIALDPDTAAAFAARHAITSPGPAVLAGHPAIRAAIAAAVEQGNARLSRVEQVKQFAIVPAFWQPGGEEITP
jgi:sirohydrochlorin ferrochelatase